MSLCGYEGFIMNNGPQTGLLRCLSLGASSRNLRMGIGLKPKQWALMTQMIWLSIVDDFLTTGWEVIVGSWGPVQLSRSVMYDSLQPYELQHARPPCALPTPGVHPNPCPFSQWCHPTISSSVVPSFSCPQSLPASGSFQMNQLFASGSQSIEISASTSVFPMNTQDWSSLGRTGWISLQSKGLSRVFSNTTVQKHQFCAQLSL